MRDYLPFLVDEIIANFPGSPAVRMDINVDDFRLDAARLQPISIIINELLTNIMRNAFEGREDCAISVLAPLKGGQVRFEVADNGRGFPKELDFERPTGFGLTLVRGLAGQLKASLRLERAEEQGLSSNSRIEEGGLDCHWGQAHTPGNRPRPGHGGEGWPTKRELIPEKT